MNLLLFFSLSLASERWLTISPEITSITTS